jgi:hypothetical protein
MEQGELKEKNAFRENRDVEIVKLSFYILKSRHTNNEDNEVTLKGILEGA